MDKELENGLKKTIDDYNKTRKAGQLTEQKSKQHKDACLVMLNNRMAVLDENKDEDKSELRECAFVASALSNGWLVSDIDVLLDFYHTVENIKADQNDDEAIANEKKRLKSEGELYIGQIASMKADTLFDRYEMLNLCSMMLWNFQHKNRAENLTETFNKLRMRQSAEVLKAEYPKDKNFDKFLELENNYRREHAENQGAEPYMGGVRYGHLQINEEYLKLRDERNRTQGEYILQKTNVRTWYEELNKPSSVITFRLTGNLTKKASACAREAMGESVYEDILAMHRGSAAERKVNLHHSLGTKYQTQGCDVLEMEFAGSGAQDVMREHKGRNGLINLNGLSEEKIRERYGEKARKPGSGDLFDYNWKKERTISVGVGEQAKNATKVRYTFAGVSPDFLWGLLNFGDYSVQSSRDNARAYAEEFLQPRLDEWIRTGTGKPIHILLSGHSRGAVTAGLAAMKINEWVTDYLRKNPGHDDLKKMIHYDVTLRDPVPGFITSATVGECKLKDIPNMNLTVFTSMGIDQPDWMFPLQHVRGVKKLILTVTDHLMDIEATDESQKQVMGNEKQGHMAGYYDAATGEVYRGTGISELPDGLYIADEKYRLIRMDSFSQVLAVYETEFGNRFRQGGRTRRIQKMARDWFVENDLEMSFTDDVTRKMEAEKDKSIKSKLLESKVSRLDPVKEKIQALQDLKKRSPSGEALIAANDELIAACRAYMKKTKLPPKSEDSVRRVGMVGDVLTFAMRERNYLRKHTRDLGPDDPVVLMDEKLSAQKNRLEGRKDYLQEKIAREQSRLKSEEAIRRIISNTISVCRDYLTTEEKFGWAEKDKKWHRLLREGAKLGDQTSLGEIKDFLDRFKDVAKSEVNEQRYKQIKENAKQIRTAFANKEDLNVPVWVRIENRQRYIDHLQGKLKSLEPEEKNRPEQKAAKKQAVIK